MKTIRIDAQRAPRVPVFTYEDHAGGLPFQIRAELVFHRHWRFTPEIKRYWHPMPEWVRLFALVKGRITVRAGDKAHVLEKPGLYLIPTSTPFGVTYDRIEMWYFHLKILDGSGLPATAGVTGVPGFSDGTAVRELMRLAARDEAGPAVFHATCRLLAPHFPELASRAQRLGPYQRIAGLVREAHGLLGAGELASRMGVRRETLSRGFHRATGMTLSAYLTQVRLEEAKKLLSGSKFSAAEVAERLGFSDRFHFYRHFRKHVGQSPMRYRARHRLVGEADAGALTGDG